MGNFGLVIHGGAGAIRRGELGAALEAEYRSRLGEALEAGHRTLAAGGGALDAVVAAIRLLEDCPLFNAGRGAVLNAEGLCELDASIMDGRTLEAGAVAAVQRIRNPISLARDVMEKSAHVMLAGIGAEKYAESLGQTLVPNEYFQTELRRAQLARAREEEAAGPAPLLMDGRISFATVDDNFLLNEAKFGTVGCVARDRRGNLAAGTSTGGMTNKKFGRVGDSPLIGAGTYANNQTCAVSATGWGEYFIRAGAARDVSSRMLYQGVPLREAAAATLAEVRRLGGEGGLICVDADGNVVMDFNSAGMYRACRVAGRDPVVAIFGDEPRG